MKQKRQQWPDKFADVRPEDIVFIDETHANTAMDRTHGYAPKGKRLKASVPHGHYKAITFIAALIHGALIAPFAMDRSMNGPWFVAWVEQGLVPLLRPGMVIVMDNLRAHKVAGVAEAIEAAGCRVEYLPPYSPDYNPIEMVFSKFKGKLRKAAPRTVDEVYAAMKQALDDFPPEECRNYFRHCGYGAATPGCRPL